MKILAITPHFHLQKGISNMIEKRCKFNSSISMNYIVFLPRDIMSNFVKRRKGNRFNCFMSVMSE